jgi:hypothetical protein
VFSFLTVHFYAAGPSTPSWSLSTVGEPDPLPKASATLFSSYQSALFLALMM